MTQLSRTTTYSLTVQGDTFSWVDVKRMMEDVLCELNAIEGATASVHVDQRRTKDRLDSTIKMLVRA